MPPQSSYPLHAQVLRVIGVDPGLAETGFAAVDFPLATLMEAPDWLGIQHAGVVAAVRAVSTKKSRERAIRATDDRVDRLTTIIGSLVQFAAQGVPGMRDSPPMVLSWGVEVYSARGSGAGLSPMALWTLAIMGGVLALAENRGEWSVALTAGDRAKAATGRASATKAEVIEAVGGEQLLRARSHGVKLLKSQAEHVADAVAIAWGTAARIKATHGPILRALLREGK